jgi:ubiquinone/menaquinone biosynthesis C-methylase UbiE
MGLEKQGSKPSGLAGKIIGRLMNQFHTSLYINFFNKKTIPENCRILDLGCGGGKFIKYLSTKSESYRLYGLDHSKEMIDLSRQLNKKAIKQNRLKLILGSVSDIEIEDNSIDLASAFETVQFWPNIDKAFSEVFRVLDENGGFLIINRYPAEGTKWWELANLKSGKDFQETFKEHGFKDVSIDLDYKKGWIIAKGIKK